MSAVIIANIMQVANLQRIPGFEETDYAYLDDAIVWVGEKKTTDHPRNAFSKWQPKTVAFKADKLLEGALICRNLFRSNQPLANTSHGLLLWLQNDDMSFPMNLGAKRFDAIKLALDANDLTAFTSAALRVLGLGNGLTPSGDDFVGGMMFAMAHAPRIDWIDGLPHAIACIHEAAKVSTNVISAALLDDMMAGKSYSALHDILIALQSNDVATITHACKNLLNVGSSSGADMLAGLLLALTPQNKSQNH